MIYNNGVFCSLMETPKNQREQRERAEPSQRVGVTRVFPPQVGAKLVSGTLRNTHLGVRSSSEMRGLWVQARARSTLRTQPRD